MIKCEGGRTSLFQDHRHHRTKQLSQLSALPGPISSAASVSCNGIASTVNASLCTCCRLHITSIKMSDPNNKRASLTSSNAKKQNQPRPAPTEGGTFDDDLLQVSRSKAKGTHDSRPEPSNICNSLRIAPAPSLAAESRLRFRIDVVYKARRIPWGLHV